MDNQPQQVNWIAQITTLICTLNTIAVAFNVYHMDDNQLKAVLLGVSAIGAVVGNIITHRK